MCGRISCIYSRTAIQERCRYKARLTGTKSTIKPSLHKCSYKRSYNIGPGMMAPALVSSNSLGPVKFNKETDRSIVGMQFGLVRSFGNVNRVINARSETASKVPMFRSLLDRQQRCVIACNGFYEWKKVGNQKIPYFCYSTQFSDLKNKKKPIKKDFGTETLTYLAAVYENRPPKLTDDLQGTGYYFAILTTRPNSLMNTIHDRMPVVISSEHDLNVWLNTDDYSMTEALKILKPCKNSDMDCHRVSQIVNNVKNDRIECILPVETKTKLLDSFVKRESSTTSTDTSGIKIEKRTISRSSSQRDTSRSSRSSAKVSSPSRRRKRPRRLSSSKKLRSASRRQSSNNRSISNKRRKLSFNSSKRSRSSRSNNSRRRTRSSSSAYRRRSSAPSPQHRSPFRYAHQTNSFRSRQRNDTSTSIIRKGTRANPASTSTRRLSSNKRPQHHLLRNASFRSPTGGRKRHSSFSGDDSIAKRTRLAVTRYRSGQSTKRKSSSY